MISSRKYRDPLTIASWKREAEEARKLSSSSDSCAIESFWNRRYDETYSVSLEGLAEFGRHGVLAEYVNRLLPGGSILDVGCGTGILSELVDQNRFTYWGIDVSARAISAARRIRENARVSFSLARIESFNPGNLFDAIVFNEVLYYLDLDKALARCNDLLAGEGLFLGSLFDFEDGLRVLEKLRDHLDFIAETAVENSYEDLKWHVLAAKPARVPQQERTGLAMGRTRSSD